MARVRIAVSFDIPDGADREDCLVYVHDAVTAWRGSLRPAGAYSDADPGDPLFYLDQSSVEASTVSLVGGKRQVLRIRT